MHLVKHPRGDAAGRIEAANMPASPPELQIIQHQVNDGVIRIVLTGEFDLANAGELAGAIEHALQAGHAAEIYVDLAETRFIDSSTVAVLVRSHQLAMAAGCQFRVLNPQGLPLQVLAITGVLPLLDGSAPRPNDSRL